MGKTVAEKMGIKEGARTFFLKAPVEAIEAMKLPILKVSKTLQGEFDYIHFFAASQVEFQKEFPKLKKSLTPQGVLWVSWRKSGKSLDLKMKDVIKLGYDFGMVESKVVSVDKNWSAIKFTHPKEGKIYNNSYGKLPS